MAAVSNSFRSQTFSLRSQTLGVALLLTLALSGAVAILPGCGGGGGSSSAATPAPDLTRFIGIYSGTSDLGSGRSLSYSFVTRTNGTASGTATVSDPGRSKTFNVTLSGVADTTSGQLNVLGTYTDGSKAVGVELRGVLPAIASAATPLSVTWDGSGYSGSVSGIAPTPTPAPTATPPITISTGPLSAVDYFPLQNGTTWTYTDTSNGVSATITDSITGTTTFLGSTATVFEDPDTAFTAINYKSYLAVVSGKLLRYGQEYFDATNTLTQTVVFNPNDRYERAFGLSVNGQVDIITSDRTTLVGKPETTTTVTERWKRLPNGYITTLAGTFQCAQFRRIFLKADGTENPESDAFYTAWSPGVGLITVSNPLYGRVLISAKIGSKVYP
jgi:hypothetical protein